MNRIFNLVFFLLLTASPAFAADTLRVLFVGNSYVQVNNLPGIISQLAANQGDVLLTTDASMGGYTLQNHSSNPNTLSLIAQKGWDYVVLQEQSQLPAFPDAQVASSCYPYARSLDSLIHVANPCAQTVFYMTWGRKNGDAGNCPSFPLICTYQGMDSLLRARYTIMAQSNKALLAPVGVAWHKMRDVYPATNLYQSDESHPSAEGSYLAACSFYTIFFKKDPSAISYNSSLSASDANNIRQIVKEQVWDSLAKWTQYRVSPALPVAGFSASLNGRNASFSNTSTGAVHYLWSFGDGNSDTAAAPQHNYAANGNYSVRLIAFNCGGLRDTLSQMLPVGPTGIASGKAQPGLKIFPNPTKGALQIECATEPTQLTLYDAQGRRCRNILQPGASRCSMDLRGLPGGLYFLHVLRADGSAQSQVISFQP